MCNKLKLSSRVSGHWSNYECYLLKDENVHVGWIEWTGSKTFKLKKNPLTKHPESPYTYIVPSEVNIPVEEGLIRVNPEKIIRDVQLPDSEIFGTYKGMFCIIDGYEPVDINKLPKPYLSKDEFLYRITSNWKGDVGKRFSKEIAINILSCPKSSYGIGGIGAQSLNPYTGKKQIINLYSTMRNIIPKDFFLINKNYMFKPIRTVNDAETADTAVKKGHSDEISYNYLFSLSPESQSVMMPTQIPLIVPEAIYKPNTWDLDRDVLDYQLSAMLLTPYIEESMQRDLQNTLLRTAQDMIRKSNMQISPDKGGTLRLMKSWCRLEHKQNIDEDDFIRMKNDLDEVFKEFFDMIDDARSLGRTYQIPLTQIPETRKLSLNANKILKCIRRICRDHGYERVSKDILRKEIPEKEISYFDIDEGIQELVNTGYLLMHKNYSEFEIVNI